MTERKITIEGSRRVTFPSDKFITPGFREFQTVREDIHEVWVGEELISSITEKVEEVHSRTVFDPRLHIDVETGESWPLRGQFTFEDRTFTVVRKDDVGFWGWKTDGQPKTKAEWFEEVKRRANQGIKEGAERGWWDVDANGDPQKLAEKVSIEEMTIQGKPLMAHLMVDLGFFPSVSQARKNGWDKPLELGRHELGPRKKRAFVEIIP